MSWQDRVGEAAYTSPSGERIVFSFENVSREVERKTSAFDFPDADGTYIQDLGTTSPRFPLRVIFWGDDYDLTAKAFSAALEEPGVGSLEHPLYGTIDVVPFGTIRRRDDLKTAANQAVIEVQFFETTGVIWPTSQKDPASAVSDAITAYNSASGEGLNTEVSIDSVSDEVGLVSNQRALLGESRSILASVAETENAVAARFRDAFDSINNSFPVLIDDLVTLGVQTSVFLQIPATALTAVSDKITSYRLIFNNLTTGDDSVRTPTRDGTAINAFATDDLYAMGCISGESLSLTAHTFRSKPEAIEAAAALIDDFTQLVEWRDANLDSLSIIDTGEAYQQLQSVVALTTGFLVTISFTLAQERRITLDRNRSLVDLVAEFYGAVDSELDFFIKSNDLSGSEIIELPAGREVVYFK